VHSLRRTSRHVERVATAALLALAAACARKSESAAPAAAASSPLDVVTRGIDSTITLGAWLRSHPSDTVRSDEPEAATSSGRRCRSARGSVVIAGRTMRRSAVFYISDPPPGEALPADTTRLADRMCSLGSVWLESSDTTSAEALALEDSLARMLSDALGASVNSADISGMGTGLWTQPRTWRGGRSVVVLGGKRERSSLTDILVAYAHNSGLDRGVWKEDLEGDTLAASANAEMLATVDSAIDRAELPALGKELKLVAERLRHAGEDDTIRTASIDSALVRIALMVRDSLVSLEPARRAAALLAADYIMNATAGRLPLDSISAGANFYRQLSAAGVSYDDDPLGGGREYNRQWLEAAYNTDSLGATGREAFVTLLSQGWAIHGTCRDGSDQFARVIEHGEAALRRGWNDPMIHIYVATAYRDIVTMALGADESGYVDSTRFTPQLPSARVNAIAHYRAALAGLANRLDRRAAWRAGMAVLLSRLHTLRYYCIYD
jgi:hypothetical protein